MRRRRVTVSVLFSEPKIPQSNTCFFRNNNISSFSALQRAENSSIISCQDRSALCASSFSALQRAENSSICCQARKVSSSARFSALQRAENSSIAHIRPIRELRPIVSVLFSEPKIPQYLTGSVAIERAERFQCSSASRKFLNRTSERCGQALLQFQCSSASRKFLNPTESLRLEDTPAPVSVLFSEPKIPQSFGARSVRFRTNRFSALQRAENSSIIHDVQCTAMHAIAVSVLFSEPKIPQFDRLRGALRHVFVSVLFSEPKIPQSIRVFSETTTFRVSVLFSEPKIPQCLTLCDAQCV